MTDELNAMKGEWPLGLMEDEAWLGFSPFLRWPGSPLSGKGEGGREGRKGKREFGLLWGLPGARKGTRWAPCLEWWWVGASPWFSSLNLPPQCKAGIMMKVVGMVLESNSLEA